MSQSNKPALFENVERLRTILQALTVAKRAAIAERDAMPEPFRRSFEERVLQPIIWAGNDVARALTMIAVTIQAALDSMPTADAPEAVPPSATVH